MAMATDKRRDQRYIGDTERSIVHDSLHEDPTPNGCNLGKLLKSGTAVRFDPDRLGQAQSEGFAMCDRCLFRLDARPSQSWKRVNG
jgi:hypothetical protein